MSDAEPTEEQQGSEQDPPALDGPAGGPGGLRAYAERVDRQNKELQRQLDELREAAGEESPSGVRKRLQEVVAENKELRGERTERERREALQEAGVPDGLLDFAAEHYDGKNDPEAIAEWANEWGIGGVADPTVLRETQERAAARERIQRVRDNSMPLPSQSDQATKIAAAEAQGDHRTANALKAAQLAKHFG